jgi:hypothetical protein
MRTIVALFLLLLLAIPSPACGSASGRAGVSRRTTQRPRAILRPLPSRHWAR